MDKWTSVEHAYCVRWLCIHSTDAHESGSTPTSWGGCCGVPSPSAMKNLFFQLPGVLLTESPQLSARFGGLLWLKRGALPQAASNNFSTQVSKPQLSSPTQDGSKGSSHLFSIEAASKLYLSLCSVLLPFLPFPRDSSQEYSLISHLLDNLHLRDCFPENSC